MVSLSAPRSTGTLVQRLGASPRPALVQAAAPDAGTPGAAHGGVDSRIELSGAVVVNWAAKAAGLLETEGVAAGDVVAVDLPEHWLAHALALGVLCAGAEPATGGPEEVPAPAAVLTDRPEAWADPAVTVMAVTLPRGLDPDFGGAALDPGVVDVAAEIRAQPDALPGPLSHVTPDAVRPGALPADAAARREGVGQEERERLTLGAVRRALEAWDAGRAFTVPA